MLKVHDNEITAFVVEGNIYRVIATTHVLERMERRKQDKYHVASACMALGTKLDSYNNSGKQIMIMDAGKNLSTVITVENYTIVVITVIDKANPYVKSNTVVEEFNYKLA